MSAKRYETKSSKWKYHCIICHKKLSTGSRGKTELCGTCHRKKRVMKK